MAAEITNRTISRRADLVFANDDQYQLDIPMAGRQDELNKFLGVMEAAEPCVVMLPAPLGSGKTFFLRKAFGQLSTKTGFPERDNSQVIYGSRGKTARQPATVENLRARFAAAKPGHVRALVVEELDRKGAFANLTWSIEQALGWAKSTPSAVLVLSGDRFLEHPAVSAMLEGAELPIVSIEFPPLERDLMVEAMALRFATKILEEREQYLSAAAELAAEAVLAEAAIEGSVLPLTDPPVANFREAFGLLKEFSSHVSRTFDGVLFGAALIKRIDREPQLPSELQAADAFIVDHVCNALRGRRAVGSLSLEDLQNASGADLDPDEFRRKIADPLVRTQVLVPAGVPYLYGQVKPDHQNVEPYLPRQNTFVRAWSMLEV
jgi:hypothetical protein